MLAGIAATGGRGRSRPDLPRAHLCHVRPCRRERPLPRATCSCACRARTRPATERRARPNVSYACARRSRRHCWDTAVVGSTLTLRPRLVPARAGSLSVRVFRDGHRVFVRGRTLKLPTGTAGHAAGRAGLHSRAPATRRSASVRRRAGRPAVARARLARRKRRRPRAAACRAPLRLQGIDGYYGTDTFEAVIAFQKVNGLPRTGRVEPWLWRGSPMPACPARTAAATTSRSTRHARC